VYGFCRKFDSASAGFQRGGSRFETRRGFLFQEDTHGYKGIRLHLNKVREEHGTPLVKDLCRQCEIADHSDALLTSSCFFPETEYGLDPRETMRLVGEIDNPRLVTNKTHQDHTERMQKWIEKSIIQLEDVRGFALKLYTGEDN
jgi:hypothetical protein